MVRFKVRLHPASETRYSTNIAQNRWILVEFLTPSNLESARDLSGQAVFTALRESVVTHFGDVGWGAVGASLSGAHDIYIHNNVMNAHEVCAVKYFSPTTNLCIIRVGRDPHRIAWAAAALLTSIDGRQVIPNVVHVSGTNHVRMPATAGSSSTCVGTIKHTQLAAIEHNRIIIARFRAKAKTPGMSIVIIVTDEG